MTIREHLNEKSPVARDERALFLAHVLGITKERLIAHDDEAVSPAAARKFRALLKRRASGEPFAYVVGEKWFYGRAFKVTKATLIPRPETERLVEAVLDGVTPSEAEGPITVTDVGTGSGAIAVTLAAGLPKARVMAIDVSEAALRVAKANAKTYGVEKRVAFRRADVTKAGRSLGFARDDSKKNRTVGTWIITANLPYIRTGDWKRLDRGITRFEPRLALTSGKDGLDHYRALMKRLGEHRLSPDLLLLEADPWQMKALAKLVRSALPEHRVEILKDLHGDDRVLVAKTRA